MSQSDPNNEKLPEELQKILKDLVKKYEREDEGIRKTQIKGWKKQEQFWHGIQQIFWSESRGDWVSPEDNTWGDDTEGREVASSVFYDYAFNIYKAHGESIIAALSSSVPAVKFPPDDADDADDVETARTYDKLVDLIQRHNKPKQLLLKILLHFWNQGLCAAYHSPKVDFKFGSLKIPKLADGLSCENCKSSYELNEDNEELQVDSPCPKCVSSIPHDDSGNPLIEYPKLVDDTIVTGFEEAPKMRVLIDAYGPLHVRVAHYAMRQEASPYIMFNIEQPTALMKSMFEHIEDKISKDNAHTSEREARAPSGLPYSYEDNDLSTLKRIWFRPWVFAGLSKEQKKHRKELEKLFPDGCYVAFVNDVYAESRNENPDEYWTIGKAGLSTYIHSDALGKPIVAVNEVRNVMLNLAIETTEEGIPDTFVDADVLDFDAYAKHEARPGEKYPVKSKGGKPIAQSFYTADRATLSKEVPVMIHQMDTDAQFLGGAFPSIYGGVGDGKSRTASEYSQSRQMALQRLSICWYYLTEFWATMFSKCVRLYIANMVSDEEKHTVAGQDKTTYQTVFIRKSQMQGKVGDVEPEGGDTFPVNSSQKQALFMKLLEMNNPQILEAVFDPNNRTLVAELLGFTDFAIPGEDQRRKQITEIAVMLKGQPVDIEPEVDDHAMHAAVLRHFMADTVGQDLKTTNPQVYAELTAHLMQHLQMQQMQAMQQQAQVQGPPQ